MPAVPFAPDLTRLQVMWISTPKSSRRLAFFVFCGLSMLMNTGCTSLSEYVRNGLKVGPNYQKPPAPVADDWIDSKSQGVNVASKDLKDWWTVFNDPVLD